MCRLAPAGDNDIVTDGIGAVTIPAYPGKGAGGFYAEALNVDRCCRSVSAVNGAV